MPTTTLYVKDADLALVEKAKQKLGDSLSAIFIDCVRRRLEELPPAKGKTGKITIETRREAGAPTLRKSFEGRWLIHPEKDDLRAENDENSSVQWSYTVTYGLARTRKGALVVYTSNPEDINAPAGMEVFQDFDELKSDEEDGYPRYPYNVIAAFAEALGEDHTIELDI